MKTGEIVLPLLSATMMVFLISCQTDPTEFIEVDVENVNETSATISWETSSDEYTGINLFMTNETGSKEYVKDIRIDGIQNKSIQIDDLAGLTSYQFSLELVKGNEVLDKEEKIFRTSYSAEKFEMETSDGYTLKGIMYYLSTWTEKVPGIIMMHGLNEVMQPWSKSETMDALIAEGYVCMTFFFRGHGNSEGFDISLFKAPEGPSYLGYDVEAAINFMVNFERIDTSKIGLMGGSMGGSATVLGNFWPEVKSGVALSSVASTAGLSAFKDYFPKLADNRLSSIYYMAGELEQPLDMDLAQMARDLHDITEEPTGLWILPGSKLHGSELATYPGVIDTTVNWFIKTLPSPYNK